MQYSSCSCITYKNEYGRQGQSNDFNCLCRPHQIYFNQIVNGNCYWRTNVFLETLPDLGLYLSLVIHLNSWYITEGLFFWRNKIYMLYSFLFSCQLLKVTWLVERPILQSEEPPVKMPYCPLTECLVFPSVTTPFLRSSRWCSPCLVCRFFHSPYKR